MENLSLFEEGKHFFVDNIVSLIPQDFSKIMIHALLTVGIVKGWKLFRKHAKKSK